MSRRDNMKRIFVGNLPPDVRTKDLEHLFNKFGRINFIDLKTRRGPPFAFVEFQDYRDAEDAVRSRDGKDFDGFRLRVEFPRGKERPSRFKNGHPPRGSHGAQQRRSKYRIKVSGLPLSGSWQDLKDHMRECGEVCFADVYKGGEGVVEFVNYDDMRFAIKKFHNTKFKSHEGEAGYIKLREDIHNADSRSRSRSPVARGRRSPSYSPPARRRGSSHSRTPSPRSPRVRRGGDRYESRSSYRKTARSVSRSRSPVKRSPSKSSSRSPTRRASSADSRDRSPKSRSRSHSRSPTSSHSDARTPSPTTRDRSRSRSHSRSSSRKSSPHSDRRKASASPSGSRDRSKSPSQSPPAERDNGNEDLGQHSSDNNRNTSKSPSPVDEELPVKDNH